MPTSGTLRKVWDNAGHWGLVIDVDEHGEHKLNLWDKKYAGVDSENNPAIADVHNWEGMRITYTAKAGSLKKDVPGESWPATIVDIALESGGPEKSVREMAAEIDEAERVAKLQAEVEQIEAEIASDVSEIHSPIEPAQEHVQGRFDELRRLATDLIINATALVEEAERVGKEA